MRLTHTFATLEVSQAAYVEIAAKLRAAGYDHAFVGDTERHIDMNGIGLAIESVSQSQEEYVPPLCAGGFPITSAPCEECGATDDDLCGRI